MRSSFVVLGCFLSLLEISAADIKYPITEIPQDLMENANAIVRLDDRQFVVHNAAKATYTRKYAVTIFNKSAQRFGHFIHHYSGKTSNLNSFKGTVYNSAGVEIDKIKKSDLTDNSSYDGFSIISDNRYQESEYNHQEYPYTVEFEYSEAYAAMMFYPSWRPQWGTKLAVIDSKYKVVMPNALTLRYKELNLKKGVEKSTAEGVQSFTWSVENLSAILASDVGPNWSELAPKVLIGPDKFTFGGYSGDMSNWESYGKWMLKLNSELGSLPTETAAKIKTLVADVPNVKEKVRRIYNYLQENTRYVSIQLGIGGWQPFSPSFVDDNGYGDCKALSYYTKAMLESVGIESLYTLVRAGSEIPKVYNDFPSSQFNHVFLCVPMHQDTIWLECTSQTNPFGYLGTFTSDRDVLLITENGGKMVHTPVLSMDQNQKISKGQVTIREDGSATAEINSIYQGIFSEYLQGISRVSVDDQKKYLYNNLGLPTFKINQLKFVKSGSETPAVRQELEIELRKLATVSGKRMFLQPNLLNQTKGIPKDIENWQTDIVLKYNKKWVDTIVFNVPEQYHPEYLPEPVSLQNEFGVYKLEVTSSPGSITFYRTLEYRKGRYAPELYESYRKFREEMVKADKTKIVLKNAT